VRPTRPRLNPALYVGLQRYSLTFCTSERCPRFTAPDVVDLVRGQILQTATAFDMVVLAYCFMPDHAHLLIEATTEQADLMRFVHQAKQRTGYTFTQQYHERLWQPSFYDHVLRDSDATLSVARYILENPVRARLVVSPRDYPFLGSQRFTIEQILEADSWQP
jgi:REP-associated tyrosine transposase